MSKRVRSRRISVCASAEGSAAAAASRNALRFGAVTLGSLLALGSAGHAAAQDVTPPRLLEKVEAETPKNAFGIPLEGWVKVRYSVLANGAIADVRVVDVMPPQLNTRSVVPAVEAWKFAPATVNGEPVDWHNNESLIVFDSENVPLEPSPMFAQTYLQITELMNKQEYEKARKQNETLLETRTMRLNEIGLAETQAALLDINLSNLHDAYREILRATDPEVVTLQDAELADALRYRFAIELELGRFAASLETYDRLAALAQLPDDDIVKTRAETVRAALKPEAAVAVKGRVAREPWSYSPTRRTFGFTDVDGTIRGVQLECDRRKQDLEFSQDVEWSIPESWGECMIFVDARRDTTFTLVEFPPAAPAE